MILKKYHYLVNFVFSSQDVYAKALLEDIERFAYKLEHSRKHRTVKESAIKISRLEYEHNISSARALQTKNIPELQFLVDGQVRCRHTHKYITLKMIRKFINECYFQQMFYPIKHDYNTVLGVYRNNVLFCGNMHSYMARRLSFWTMRHSHDNKHTMYFWVRTHKMCQDLGMKWNSISHYRREDKKMQHFNRP